VSATRAPRLLGLVLGYLLACVLGTALASRARAEAQLDVAAELRGVPLGAHMMLLADESRALTLEDVLRPGQARHFVPASGAAPGLGFTQAAYWVRLVVHSSADEPRPWLLELSYPHLDSVSLYVPDDAGGYRVRSTGDNVPFAQRDLAFRNFVFALEQPARTTRTYYLRVATTGSLSLPLRAWTLTAFTEHEYLDWAGLCIFYGVLSMMAAYHLALYAFSRDREVVRFALFVLSIGAFQMTMVGHTFQFLFPESCGLAQTAMPVSIAVCMLCTAWFGHAQLEAVQASARDRRVVAGLAWAGLVTVLIAAVTPFVFAIRLVPVCCVVSDLVAFRILWRVLREHRPRATLYVLGWSSVLIGTVVYALKVVGVLPDNALTMWSVQLGASIHVVCLSAGMATKLTWLRRELATATAALGTKIHALEDAVQRAEHATAQAARAARVKDEFIAALTHELRTPLNAIINVPQGLAREFPLGRYAVCEQCQGCFELEPEEWLSPNASCPDCQFVGTLRLREVASYVGEPVRTTRYLETIERSGKHLLQVVDGILRFSHQPEREREQPLSPAEVTLQTLLREVVEEMRAVALPAGVELSLALPRDALVLRLDALRIRQVLLNLLGNAIKFSPRHTAVTVTLSADETSCLVTVRDHGIGIATDQRERVFERYAQVQHEDARQYGGTGLGLPIARALVEQHGGTLSVESELGHGATFFVRLPRPERQRQSA
jgi:signal transduction histidine kinase